MQFFNKIIKSGISQGELYQKKRSLLITNHLSIILLASVLILYLNRLLRYGDNKIDILIFGVILFIIPIVCNRFGLTNFSRIFLCFMPIIMVWTSFTILVHQSNEVEIGFFNGIRIFLVAFSFIPYLLFNKSELIYLIIGILPTFLSVIFFDHIVETLHLNHIPFEITGREYELMSIRTFISYLIVGAGCFTFQSVISYNDNYNRKILDIVKTQSDQIKQQNRKLIRAQSRLSKLNSQLEEIVESKTESIKWQNEILIKYSFQNAHQLRGPVARILGLLYLFKKETKPDYDDFFRKVENETIEIDKTIKSISKDFNDTFDRSI